ncbi:MAG: hypothetical protein AAGH74_11720 [Pseudomonadota bacterium]
MKKIVVTICILLALGIARPAGVTAEGDQTTFRRLDAAFRAQDMAEIRLSSLSQAERRARVSALLMMFNTASGSDAMGLRLR